MVGAEARGTFMQWAMYKAGLDANRVVGCGLVEVDAFSALEGSRPSATAGRFTHSALFLEHLH